MKRVVITGFGIISSIGNTKEKVLKSLQNGISGVVFSKEMRSIGLRSNIWGNIYYNPKSINSISKKNLKFMTPASIYLYLSMLDAIKDSKLSSTTYSYNPRVGLIVGSGIGAIQTILNDLQFFSKKNTINPYLAFKSMTSSVSALLGSIFKIYGCNYSVSAACNTSSYCIVNAIDLIISGKQDIIFTGGGEELNLVVASQFDAMRILSKNFNHMPECASRPFDNYRDGFVISGGSGILVLEELHSALSRKAKIYAEVIGYSITCDGLSPISPSGEGLMRCMRNVLININNKIDYLNVHGTSTKIGDKQELFAIKKVFKQYKYIPIISSTKSITGHSLGASGVHEIIYILLMMKNNFIAPSLNINFLDPAFSQFPILQERKNKELMLVMSNNLGFGGSNFSIVLKKYLL